MPVTSFEGMAKSDTIDFTRRVANRSAANNKWKNHGPATVTDDRKPHQGTRRKKFHAKRRPSPPAGSLMTESPGLLQTNRINLLKLRRERLRRLLPPLDAAQLRLFGTLLNAALAGTARHPPREVRAAAVPRMLPARGGAVAGLLDKSAGSRGAEKKKRVFSRTISEDASEDRQVRRKRLCAVAPWKTAKLSAAGASSSNVATSVPREGWPAERTPRGTNPLENIRDELRFLPHRADWQEVELSDPRADHDNDGVNEDARRAELIRAQATLARISAENGEQEARDAAEQAALARLSAAMTAEEEAQRAAAEKAHQELEFLGAIKAEEEAKKRVEQDRMRFYLNQFSRPGAPRTGPLASASHKRKGRAKGKEGSGDLKLPGGMKRAQAFPIMKGMP